MGFDRVRFKTFSLGSCTSAAQKRKFSHFLPSREELLRQPTGVERAVCGIPLFQSVVVWNGDLGLCCIDYDRVVELLNIGFLKRFDICAGCSFGNAGNNGIRVDLR